MQKPFPALQTVKTAQVSQTLRKSLWAVKGTFFFWVVVEWVDHSNTHPDRSEDRNPERSAIGQQTAPTFSFK